MLKAIIFDCDGVLVDTERDGHRVAFNRAFKALGIDAEWDVPLYAELLLVAGGKERMRAYFDRFGWPEGRAETRDELILALHKKKTAIFVESFVKYHEEKPKDFEPLRLIDAQYQACKALFSSFIEKFGGKDRAQPYLAKAA